MRRKHIIFLVVVMFFTWNMLMYFTIVTKSTTPRPQAPDVKSRLQSLQDQIEVQLKENESLLDSLRKLREETLAAATQKPPSQEVVAQVPVKPRQPNSTGSGPDKVVLPILMIACDRKEAVVRSLDLVLKYRPDKKRFPVIVSQDCDHKPTADTIQTYVQNQGIVHIQQPDHSKIDLPWPQRKFEGYYKISRHYKWALNQIFHTFNYSAVIIIEDDLDISPDFYEYFAATYRVLSSDPTLWCVSAWNDNGKRGMVKDDPELLHRTDFFPGLGWMMEKKMWLELSPKWPETFWDDWMRHPDQRKGRSCIRPELCRTSTFGKKGVSKGLFYEKHLKFIQLNEKLVKFTEKDLSYLKKESYDRTFREHIYSLPEVSVDEVHTRSRQNLPEVRVTYRTKDEFKNLAKKLGIMDDFKAGVARAAYLGVVSFMFNNQRVNVAPPSDWTGYNPSWS